MWPKFSNCSISMRAKLKYDFSDFESFSNYFMLELSIKKEDT